MVDDNSIKEFVRETLGCQCPDSVFDIIEYTNNKLLDGNSLIGDTVNVGNRLLIYIIHTNEPSQILDNLTDLVRSGIAERDSKGFNRFRLVVATDDIEMMKVNIESEFVKLDEIDDRVHLHIIEKSSFNGLFDQVK
jgi:hypothetical protein